MVFSAADRTGYGVLPVREPADGPTRLMSVEEPPPLTPFPPPQPRRLPPRLKKLRLLLICSGLAALAMVSTVFGMMMAVSSDLPDLENLPQYRHAENSTLWDTQNRRL